MLDYEIIENKNKILLKSNHDGGTYTECYDLLSMTINPKVPLNGYKIKVNKYYIARPDLISQALYRTDKYADIICKINGISNPFELNEGDILYCPTFELLIEFLNKAGNGKESDLIDDEIQRQTSAELKLAKLVNERRNPAEKTVNDSNFYIDKTNNLIFY